MNDDPLSNPRRWYVADAGSDRIRFTATGRAALAAELARAGIDLRQLRTRRQALGALEVLSARSTDRLASFRGQHPLLDEILAPLFADPTP